MESLFFDPALTKPDRLVLQNLANDIGQYAPNKPLPLAGTQPYEPCPGNHQDDSAAISTLNALNNPSDAAAFEPTVFTSIDMDGLQTRAPLWLQTYLLLPYVRAARKVVRVETDVVMLTHLLLYAATSLPSAACLLFGANFSWLHGVLHAVMQLSYMGTYTLMMHQHIHMHGILHQRLSLLDTVFPYVTDPLMGHTWNSYYYHHVKHHHVEGNGPDDLSSTLRYQRDSRFDFACYVGRFYFFIWLDLPLYFIRTKRPLLAAKTTFWELGTYAVLYAFFRINPRATVCVFLVPLALLRAGLMVGNWGQHAFVDHDEPDSDYRSSITLIDVAVRSRQVPIFRNHMLTNQSNRHCYNDGYHTSHHLNPLRHWREHPVSFLQTKQRYSSEHALVFHNIDYIMITVRLLRKDYRMLAECMVPLSSQVALNMEERMALLRSHTKRFTEEEIQAKYKAKNK